MKQEKCNSLLNDTSATCTRPLVLSLISFTTPIAAANKMGNHAQASALYLFMSGKTLSTVTTMRSTAIDTPAVVLARIAISTLSRKKWTMTVTTQFHK